MLRASLRNTPSPRAPKHSAKPVCAVSSSMKLELFATRQRIAALLLPILHSNSYASSGPTNARPLQPDLNTHGHMSCHPASAQRMRDLLFSVSSVRSEEH